MVGLIGCGSDAGPRSSDAPVPTEDGVRESEPATAPVKTVREKLEGLEEPLAEWLLSTDMTDDGVLAADYMVVLENVGMMADDCPLSQAKTFVLSDDLIGGKPFPRTVSTICNGGPEGGKFFLAASFQDRTNPKDIDLRKLEMFVWEESQKRHIFYAMNPVPGPGGLVKVDVEPERCPGCHLTPANLDRSHMPMLPIMNELTQPWPHWNGVPGFVSHETFLLPDETRDAPNFRKVIGFVEPTLPNTEPPPATHLAPAREFELTIKDAIGRVNAERIKMRNQPAQLDQAMSMLRPLFCEEQINYASEDGGEFLTTAIVPMHTPFAKANMASQWAWQEEKMHFEDANTPLNLVPVRGYSDIEFEGKLMSFSVLKPLDVLRVRAIDWRRPLFSPMRCDMWKRALAKLRAGEIKVKIARGETNQSLVKKLLPLVLTDESGSLIPAAPDKLIAISRIQNASVTGPRLISERKEVTMREFGDMIQVHFDEVLAAGRPPIGLLASENICIVEKEFPNQPALPEGACNQARVAMAAFEAARSLDGRAPPAVKGAAKPVVGIPDGDPAGVKSIINIGYDDPMFASKAPVNSIAVRVSIQHPWRGDLVLILTAPGGTSFTLANFGPTDSADNVEQLFTPIVSSEIPPGDWTLQVIDRKAENVGVLRHWTLGINTEAPQMLDPGERPIPTQKH